MDSKANKQEVKSHVMKKQWLKAMKSYTTKKAEAQEKMEKKKIEAENAMKITAKKAKKILEENLKKKKEAEREKKTIQPRSRSANEQYWIHDKDEGWIKKMDYGYETMGAFRSGKWCCQNDFCQTPEVAHSGSSMEQTWSDRHGDWIWICWACIPVPEDSDGVDICVEDSDVDML